MKYPKGPTEYIKINWFSFFQSRLGKWMAFERRSFSGTLPDYEFNDLKIITTVSKKSYFSLERKVKYYVALYVFSHIDALRDENVQVFSRNFTFQGY